MKFPFRGSWSRLIVKFGEYIYESLLGVIFRNRGLRVESEYSGWRMSYRLYGRITHWLHARVWPLLIGWFLRCIYRPSTAVQSHKLLPQIDVSHLGGTSDAIWQGIRP